MVGGWELIILGAATAILVPALGAGITAVGWALWGLSIRDAARANDPPVPDFRYDEAVRVKYVISLPPLPALDTPSAALGALMDVLALLDRVHGAHDAMERSYRKMLGAYIDGATESLQRQLDCYREASDALVRAGKFIADTMTEAEQVLGVDEAFALAPLRSTAAAWKQDGIPARTRELWVDAGVPIEHFGRIDEMVRVINIDSISPIPTLLERLSSTLLEFIRAVDIDRESINQIANVTGEEPQSLQRDTGARRRGGP